MSKLNPFMLTAMAVLPNGSTIISITKSLGSANDDRPTMGDYNLAYSKVMSAVDAAYPSAYYDITISVRKEGKD